MLFDQYSTTYSPVLASTENLQYEDTPNPLNGNLIPHDVILGLNTNITYIYRFKGGSTTNTYNYDNANGGRLLYGTNSNGDKTSVLYNCSN